MCMYTNVNYLLNVCMYCQGPSSSSSFFLVAIFAEGDFFALPDWTGEDWNSSSAESSEEGEESCDDNDKIFFSSCKGVIVIHTYSTYQNLGPNISGGS